MEAMDDIHDPLGSEDRRSRARGANSMKGWGVLVRLKGLRSRAGVQLRGQEAVHYVSYQRAHPDPICKTNQKITRLAEVDLTNKRRIRCVIFKSHSC